MIDKSSSDSLRADLTALTQALETLGATIRGRSATCIEHDDKTPSASIYERHSVWRLYCQKCQKGWDVFDLREKATGVSVDDQLRTLNPRTPTEKPPVVYATLPDVAATAERAIGGKIQARYDYANPSSAKVELYVWRIIRTDGTKGFFQATPHGAGFIAKGHRGPNPLYNRTRLITADTVIIVEGEKCVHALHEVGIVATTSPGGAKQGRNADWMPLCGKRVVFWRDHDDAGLAYQNDVIAELAALPQPPKVSIIDPSGLELGAGGDVADFLAKLGPIPNEQKTGFVNAVVEDAAESSIAGELAKFYQDIFDGRIKAVSWPWFRLTKLSRSLLPGTVTVLCGAPGAAKSLMALEAAAHWHGQGESVAIYELEEDRKYHLARALAQRTGQNGHTDIDWLAGHPGEAKADLAQHRDFLESFGACIYEASNREVTLKELADWTDRMCKAGKRMIVIDPISAADAGKDRYREDLAFMMRVKRSAKDHGASVVLVTHPKIGVNKGANPMDSLSGGASYQRFAQNVLWLDRFPDGKDVRVNGLEQSITNSLVIMKARNGPGAGAQIGYVFDVQSLCMAEVGLIEKKKTNSFNKDDA